MPEIIRNEFGKAVGVVLYEDKYAAAIYAIPEDRTYYDLKGADDLTRDKAEAALRGLKRALKAGE